MLTRRTTLMVLGTLLLLVICFAPDVEAAGQRVVARVDEPFEVNGQVYPAGELSLRAVRDYTPVATLNEVCVARECLGLLVAQEVPGQESHVDELIFTRHPKGHLVLESVAFKGEPRRTLAGFNAPELPLPAIAQVMRSGR